jgi:hypothetical protein
MDRAQGHDFQDQHVQRAFEEFGFLVSGHSQMFDILCLEVLHVNWT